MQNRPGTSAGGGRACHDRENNKRIWMHSNFYAKRPRVGLVALLSIGVGGASDLSAYSKAVGEEFATDTAVGLRRFQLRIWPRDQAKSESRPLTLIVDPDLPSAAIEALIDLQDQHYEELGGVTMRWDPGDGRWQNVEAIRS